MAFPLSHCTISFLPLISHLKCCQVFIWLWKIPGLKCLHKPYVPLHSCPLLLLPTQTTPSFLFSFEAPIYHPNPNTNGISIVKHSLISRLHSVSSDCICMHFFSISHYNHMLQNYENVKMTYIQSCNFNLFTKFNICLYV